MNYFNNFYERLIAHFLFAVQFIDQFSNGGLSFGISIMLVNALLVGLLDCDDGVTCKVLEFRKNFLGHFPYTVFDESRIFVRGKNHISLVAAL